MYLSSYTPEDHFRRMLGKIYEYGEETRMPNRFQKDENGNLVPLMTVVKKQEIEFRDSSSIEIEKKPCGCRSKQIKKNLSS